MQTNRKGKRKQKQKQKQSHRVTQFENDMAARRDGPSKKTWSNHDMIQVQPKTERQHDVANAFYSDMNIVTYGSAGTGKTFFNMSLALSDVIEKNFPQRKLIIVRSAVASRAVGHLPGELNDKLSVFETPYRDICSELFQRANTYDDMKQAGVIEFISTSFIRGSTWDNAMILIDEAQNMTWHELNSIMTRVGEHSRILVSGDILQDDLNRSRNDTSGMARLLRTCEHINSFATVEYTPDDIVRSGFVKEWILATEKTKS